MGLCDRPAAWGQITKATCICPIDPGVCCYGGVHQGGITSGIHPSFPFSCNIRFLLCGEAGWGPTPLYRLSSTLIPNYHFSYPLPLVPNLLEDLCGALIFTKLDLCSAYLSNSPSIFQNFMNEILRDMLNQFVIIYILRNTNDTFPRYSNFFENTTSTSSRKKISSI